ncbi:hypothetical protein CEUSTIGMA_g1889.t1 [Chlamydomonas eustigma]|uniref:alpha,alpha-trehalose-phosphate synthase (UDP-forming) n=1 Tax=Chlamydomonas eustigma TaxID=1157962 RepID=A0A250WV73_9CHLO|nr:hypothetical protein CEUSTIGMA_g1889.t1 [Chlamydomonas eustigma]|eukprot:GAX74440.1 hypothetical protein CEUSTIGMA_g1889.t1 [Chlamydomonas eustigma]
MDFTDLTFDEGSVLEDRDNTPPSLPPGMLNQSSLPSSRVDRLLMERMRRNLSHQQFEDLTAFAEELLESGGDNANSRYVAAAAAAVAAIPSSSLPEMINVTGACLSGGLMTGSERLMVVANRLPVTCIRDTSCEAGWQLQISSGGLVSALKGVSSYRTVWIGWPGIWVKPGRDRDQLSMMLQEEGYIPVWIDPTLLDLYYNGFCNSVLWQLFHYVPLNIDSWQKMAEHRAMQMQWQAYQVANQKFADAVLSAYEEGDIVWVQDYHLMQLPMLLKNEKPKMKVGFFLHIPFPSSEIYRTLPVREELLKAVLGADLIGFHTYDYARHFISSCTRILGLEGTPEGVENNGSVTRVGTFPIGIDPERFTRSLETEEVQSNIAKLLNRYAGRKIMLGVDRLDMVKGIPQKLLAYEKFLEEHPEWRDKVLLVQIAVPSRTDVPEYQKLRSMVHEIVGRINGQFGTLTYVPITHLDTSLSFTELCALYAVTDVALVSSLRDGMNLVSYEYVACQSDNAGVLVLSEFAGAAQSLGAGAILVNPWNITDTAQAIADALTMSEEERRERHRQNYMHVQTHTAQNWADNFISELNDTHIEADLRMRHAPAPLNMQDVVGCYEMSKRRLIVLGYNATLTTSVEAPRGPKRHFDQVKALAKVNPKIIASIQELCQDPNNTIVILSGSETSKLEDVFASLPIWLAAENGVYVRPPSMMGQTGRSTWVALFDNINRDWMEAVQLVLDYFCERTPRSFVETRETSLVWNYKYADMEFGRTQARDLLQHLWTGPISNAPVEIIQGGRSVEVRPVGVTKGLGMQRLMGLIAEMEGGVNSAYDFVLCIGHLLVRDENIFTLFEGVPVEGSSTAQPNGFHSRELSGLGLPHTLSGNLHQPHELCKQKMSGSGMPQRGLRVGLTEDEETLRNMMDLAVVTPRSQLTAKIVEKRLEMRKAVTSERHSPDPGTFEAAAVGTLGVEPGVASDKPAVLTQEDLDLKLYLGSTEISRLLREATASPPASAMIDQVLAAEEASLLGGTLSASPDSFTAAILAPSPSPGSTVHDGVSVASRRTTPADESVSRPLTIPTGGGSVSLAVGNRSGDTVESGRSNGQDFMKGLLKSVPAVRAPPRLNAVQSASGLKAPTGCQPISSDALSRGSSNVQPSPLGAPSPSYFAEAGSHTVQLHAQPHLSMRSQDKQGQLLGVHTGLTSGVPGTVAGGSLNGMSGDFPAAAAAGHQSLHHHPSGGLHAPGTPGGVSSLFPPAETFPPTHLFTCTVGRNSSKARYALSVASDVGELLDRIVQQCIYHQPPTADLSQHDSSPHGSLHTAIASGGGGGGAVSGIHIASSVVGLAGYLLAASEDQSRTLSSSAAANNHVEVGLSVHEGGVRSGRRSPSMTAATSKGVSFGASADSSYRSVVVGNADVDGTRSGSSGRAVTSQREPSRSGVIGLNAGCISVAGTTVGSSSAHLPPYYASSDDDEACSPTEALFTGVENWRAFVEGTGTRVGGRAMAKRVNTGGQTGGGDDEDDYGRPIEPRLFR